MGVKVYSDLAALARSAGQDLLDQAREAIARSGRFTVALPGGSTPAVLFEWLAGTAASMADVWRKTHFFWGDERVVPPDHPDSNYRLARDTLLTYLPIGQEQVHRIPTELGLPENIAQAYEEDLGRFFRVEPGGMPAFDLVVLGVGADGHTASLFPGNEVLGERRRWVGAPWVPALAAHRISMTLPVLCQARQVFFLAAGEAKAKIVARILGSGEELTSLASEGGQSTLPAAMIRPQNGEPTWYLDRLAAALLESTNGGANGRG